MLFAYCYSGRIIFVPQNSSYKDTSETLKIETSDGVTISSVYLFNPRAKFTILFSHGNAEDLGDIRPLLDRFYDKGFSVFGYDYHGYGTSRGRASEKNAYRDVEAVYKYLVEQLKVEPERIIVMGRSVGGGPSTHIASKEKIGALILESTFVTAFRVKTRIPLLPFDKFRNISKIKNVNCPVLIIHGKADKMIPIWHGKKLFQAAREPKFSLWIEGAGHNDDLARKAGDRYWAMFEKLTAAITTKHDESGEN
jgi:fermentation-respiration switch protein FrsA (DUF1100 family)